MNRPADFKLSPSGATLRRRALDAGWVRYVHPAQRDPTHHERTFQFGSFFIDIHQSFIQRARHRIDYDAIWRRRVPMDIGGQHVFRLEDVDALTYHALSMSIDQFDVRLIRFVDLWLMLRQRDGIAAGKEN